MARLGDALRSLQWSTALVVGMSIILALLLGPLFVIVRAGTREVVMFGLGVFVILVILVSSERFLKIAFVLWLITFGFGWRTFHVTDYLSIHPAEVMAWLIFVLLLIHRVLHHEPLDLSFSSWVPILMLLSAAGVVTALGRNTPVDVIVQESKVLFSLVPCFYTVKWMIHDRAGWEWAWQITVLVAVYVAGLGLLDYYAPALSQTLSGNSTIQTFYVNEQQFGRVGFIFYGNFSAGFLIFTFFGMTVYYFLANLASRKLIRLVAGLAVLVEIAGMYLSGFRGLYIAIGVFLLVYTYAQRRLWILPAAAVGVLLLPVSFINRLQSLADPQYADSSQTVRLARAADAWDLIRGSPLGGVGWGGAGYVHSDLLQIGANLGTPALAVFLLWLVSVLWSLFRLLGRQGWIGEAAGALLATLCGLLVVFAGEGLIIWPQLMVPIWFLIAMCYKLNELAIPEIAEPIDHLQEPAKSPQIG